jgi:predicted 3-demethylubiquinone-9 3-methyltransferase (glyoxalase superfamily)
MAEKFSQKISPFLWFDGTAEEAANFYAGIFPNSKITSSTRYTKESAAVSGQPEGKLMTVGFELDGQEFAAINGGPHFKFTEAISFVIHCASQEEVDHYWNKLGEGGDPKAQQCGWLKDKFGVSWQVVPDEMFALMSDPDAVKAGRVAKALFSMKKIDLGVLRQAHGG